MDFYAVPKVDIAAIDSAGGFIASVGGDFDLHDHIPLVYISPARECFLITEDSSQFLSIASCWKSKLVPYKGVTLYPTKEAAMKDYPITNVVDTEEYQMLMDLEHN